jgi:hypothetical protein
MYRVIERSKDYDIKWERFSILLLRKHHLSSMPVTREDVLALKQESSAEYKPIVLVTNRGEAGFELSLRKRWEGSRVRSAKEHLVLWGIYALDTEGIKVFALLIEKLGVLLVQGGEVDELMRELSNRDCPCLIVDKKPDGGFNVILATDSEVRKLISREGFVWKQ